MPESGLRFLIGPILTACLNLGVAGLMGTQGEAAGQEVMPIFPLLFGGGSTATVGLHFLWPVFGVTRRPPF